MDLKSSVENRKDSLSFSIKDSEYIQKLFEVVSLMPFVKAVESFMVLKGSLSDNYSDDKTYIAKVSNHEDGKMYVVLQLSSEEKGHKEHFFMTSPGSEIEYASNRIIYYLETVSTIDLKNFEFPGYF